MIETLSPSLFPPLPAFEAEWAPVYMEPVVQSGERLTVAVVARSGTDVQGRLTISEKALRCLYGDSAAGMRSMMSMALDRAIEHCRSGFRDAFTPGIHGIYLGESRQGFGSDMEHILQQAASLSASLSAIHATALTGNQEDEDGVEFERSLDRLRSDIKQLVMKGLPGMTDRFNMPINPRDSGKAGSGGRLFFAGNRVAANVVRMKPSRGLSFQVDSAKSRLWDLHRVKHIIKAPQQHHVLLICIPQSLAGFNAGLVDEYQANLSDLRRQTEDEGIEPALFYSPSEAASSIIAAEAA